MQKRSSKTRVSTILKRLESSGVQLIPRDGDGAAIRGQFGPEQRALLMELLPAIDERWSEIVQAIHGRDVSETAAAVFRVATADTGESPAATMGRVGGLKGGKARAEKLSPEKRAEIARKAAAARWKDR